MLAAGDFSGMGISHTSTNRGNWLGGGLPFHPDVCAFRVSIFEADQCATPLHQKAGLIVGHFGMVFDEGTGKNGGL